MTEQRFDVTHLRYETFPIDGNTYWVRWIDGVDLRDPTGTPRIHVLLSPIPQGTSWSLRDLAPRLDTQDRKTCDVSIGDMLTLRLGMVFENRLKIGDLDMMPSEQLMTDKTNSRGQVLRPGKSFAFGGSENVLEIGCGEENKFEKPGFRTYSWPVLPWKLYLLVGFDEPRCVHFVKSGLQVVVPSSEIFRSFFALEDRLALALLSSLWPVARERIANVSVSEVGVDWVRVGLRKGLTEKSATVVAAFLFTKVGREAASSLLAHETLSKALKNLGASVPYAFDEIEIAGDGLTVFDDAGLERFLMLRVRSVSFLKGLRELPKRILFRLDNYNSERRAPSGGSSFDFPIPEPLPHPDDELLRNLSREMPAAVSGEAIVSSPMVSFLGMPEVERVELTMAEDGEAAERGAGVPLARPVEVSSVSSAAPQRGYREVGHARHIPGDETVGSEIFDGLVVALDAAKAAGAIEDWAVCEPENVRNRRVSGRVVWLVPDHVEGKRCRFSRLRSGWLRGCLVVGISFKDRVVYWLELDRDDGQNLRLLLVERTEPAAEQAIFESIQDAFVANGVWSGIETSNARVSRNLSSKVANHTFEPPSSSTVSISWVEGFLRSVGASGPLQVPKRTLPNP